MRGVERVVSAGLKAGEVGGVVFIADGLLRGSLVQLEVGVGLTVVAVGVNKAREMIDQRRSKNLPKQK